LLSQTGVGVEKVIFVTNSQNWGIENV